MRRDRRDEAFNRWEVPLADLNGRLSVPEAVALSPPGGRWPRTASRLDGTPRHLRPGTGPPGGILGPPQRPFRPAMGSPLTTHSVKREQNVLKHSYRFCTKRFKTSLREGEIPRPRWADVNFTEEGREAGHYRQGTRGTVGAIRWPPGARRWPVSTSCTRTAEYLVVNHVDRRCLTKTPWEAVTVAFLRIGYGPSPRWPR